MMSGANTVGRTTSMVAFWMRCSASETVLLHAVVHRQRDGMASMMTTPPSTMTPKSTAPIDGRLADMPAQLQVNERTASDSGMRPDTTSAARQVEQEGEEHRGDGDGALEQVEAPPSPGVVSTSSVRS